MGHIEMILAFILFVGFLFFGLYFFNPLSADRLLDSSADYAVREIVQNVSGDTTMYSVVINSTDPAVIGIPLVAFQAPPQNAFLVLNSAGTVLDSETQGATLTFDRGNERFVRVISGTFDAQTSSVGTAITLNSGNYTISSTEVKSFAYERALELLKTRYDADYVDLKKDFNLPGRVDFSFAVMFSETKNITGYQEVPAGLEAVARQQRIEILMNNGTVQFADLIVRVW